MRLCIDDNPADRQAQQHYPCVTRAYSSVFIDISRAAGSDRGAIRARQRPALNSTTSIPDRAKRDDKQQRYENQMARELGLFRPCLICMRMQQLMSADTQGLAGFTALCRTTLGTSPYSRRHPATIFHISQSPICGAVLSVWDTVALAASC